MLSSLATGQAVVILEYHAHVLMQVVVVIEKCKVKERGDTCLAVFTCKDNTGNKRCLDISECKGSLKA